MKIILNGEEKFFSESLSVYQLLAELELDQRKIAVERNLEVVSRSHFAETMLSDGDIIELIHFIGGG